MPEEQEEMSTELWQKKTTVPEKPLFITGQKRHSQISYSSKIFYLLTSPEIITPRTTLIKN